METFFFHRDNQKLDTIENDIEFSFKSMTRFLEKIQEFFFEQFSFYTLKYTKKSSSKDEFELNTTNLSWATYFKSIYLESSNYDYLFFDTESIGAQGKKIFEMILGLPLTYPINMLNIQLDKTTEEIGRIKLMDRSKMETMTTKKKELENQYAITRAELAEAEKLNHITFSEKSFVAEYIVLQESINAVRKLQRIAEEAYQNAKTGQRYVLQELENLREDRQKVQAEINRLGKQELNVELYRQAESFFTNLEIKVCPHCETEVSDHKKAKEHHDHTCSLCGETPTETKVDEAELQEKAERIKQELTGHHTRLQKVEENILIQTQSLQKQDTIIAELYNQLVAIPSMQADINKLKELEDKIESIARERKNQQQLFEKKDKLIQEEAVLKFQLDDINNTKQTDNSQFLARLQLKKDILEYALASLGKKRIKLNESILEILEKLILSEVNAFGLVSITRIQIDEKFNLWFTQNTVPVDFSQLESGEKLRVKLGFYLSLIQLDIEYNLGRHPRFLIFDSPGSEEMVPKHLNGLSDILKSVNKRFPDQLQIFIGSVLRELGQITEPEKTFVKAEDEFLF
ncbi:MAG: hypothetical protein ACTHNW_09095 [Mucilaginibacter sp.]